MRDSFDRPARAGACVSKGGSCGAQGKSDERWHDGGPESSSKSSTKSFEVVQKENACAKKKKMLKSEPVTKDQPHDGPGHPQFGRSQNLQDAHNGLFL
jgi:hypothetical protein